MSELNKDLNEAFFANNKKSQKQKTLDKYGVKDYAPDKGAMPLYGLGAFEDTDTREIEKRLTKAFGASMSNNTMKAQSGRAVKSFPLIVSDKVSPEIVYTFKNIFEENYAQYISLLVSNQVVDLGEYETSKDNGNIAIQVLDDLSSTDLKKTRLLQKAANTGNISMDDILGPAGALLGFTEDMKTGNDALDSLLEDAMICEANNSGMVEEALSVLYESGKDNKSRHHSAYNMRSGGNLKFQSLPDYIFDDNADPAGGDLAKFMNYTVANELSGESDTIRDLREDFLIASKLMGARKISGSEFLAYLYHLGIPVPRQTGYAILNRFPISEVRYVGNSNYSIGDVKMEKQLRPMGRGAINALKESDFLLNDLQIKAMNTNKKIVTQFMGDIVGVNLKDILYTFYKNKYFKNNKIAAAVGGTTAGIGGIATAIAAGQGVGWLAGPLGALAGAGLATFIAAMIIHGKKLIPKWAAKKAKTSEKEVLDDIEIDAIAKDKMGTNETFSHTFNKKWFTKMRKGYEDYLSDLRKSNPDEYRKLVKATGGNGAAGTYNNIPLYIPDEMVVKSNLGGSINGFKMQKDKSVGADPEAAEIRILGKYELKDMDEWERVQTLVEVYKSQRRSTNVQELYNNFVKHPVDGKYFATVNDQLKTLIDSANADATSELNDYISSLNKGLRTADSEYDKAYGAVENRTKLQEACANLGVENGSILWESYEEAFEKSDYKPILLTLDEEAIPMDMTDYQLPAELITEAMESGDPMLISLCEYMTVDEKKAQQKEIQKILTATPMKKYEYDSVQGKTVIAPAFAGSKELVYGAVEYDAKAQEKRRFGTPLMLKITFRKRFDDGKFADNDLVAYIGILAEIITVPSEEMEYVLEKNADGSTIKNFFTGKISAKDAISDIFGTSKIKADVKNLPVSADVWKNLEAVSRRVVANKLAGKSSGNLSNAHFLFSDAEIANLRNRANIDYYRDKKLAQAFMERYSAFTFAIINESTERVYMLDDPASVSYQIIPLSVIRGANTTDSMVSAISALQGRRI